MKKEFLEEQKKSLPFKKFDIIIYSILLVIVILFFLLIHLLFNNDKNIGFKVTVNNNLVLTYIYEDDIVIEEAFHNQVFYKKEDNMLKITIYIDNEKNEFNILKVDLIEKSVYMEDANCSLSKDCTKFSPITDKSGTIICLPHKLYVIPLSGGYISPTIGG